MAGMDGCGCGCWQSAEARAMAEKVSAENHEEFERRWAARPEPKRPPLPRLPGDHETQALAETHWRQTIAVPAVRRIG